MATPQKFEKFSTIFLLAGICSLVFAFLTLGLGPAIMVENVDAESGLPLEIPENVAAHYPSIEDYHQGLLNGRDIYIAEACWHCHSQYVRPVSNEALRYGPVSQPGEYQNVLHLPQLFGTRRVGPDLSREAGKRTNDWHYAHLYNPQWTSPRSIMPAYPWLFEKQTDEAGKEKIIPNQKAIDLVAYLQSLGHQTEGFERKNYGSGIILPPTQ